MQQTSISDMFSYVFPVFSGIAVAASQTQSLQISADSDFEVLQMAYHMTVAQAAFTDSTRPVPNMSIMLLDTGSGRNLMNNPVPLASIAGTGVNPYFLPVTKTFARNAQIQATLTNFDAAVATAYVYITLVGRKIYQLGPVA